MVTGQEHLFSIQSASVMLAQSGFSLQVSPSTSKEHCQNKEHDKHACTSTMYNENNYILLHVFKKGLTLGYSFDTKNNVPVLILRKKIFLLLFNYRAKQKRLTTF